MLARFLLILLIERRFAMTYQLIKRGRDLTSYFMELVENAASHKRVDVSPTAKFYLVNLLSEFIKTDQLFNWEDNHYEEVPLAQFLKRALEAETPVRIKIFKKMGDVSLYIAGYFSDHIERKSVDIDYYISMGEGAYKNLSGILAGTKVFHELYGELAERFVDFVGIVSHVRNSGRIVSNSEILRLYERWLKTGDEEVKERLEREGIVPKRI